ncbi:hypothetical protein [Rhodococcus sp. SMB37]|uniref:hypothetical protein n=1 Tax=Rhodococcus sp. SMB37 TaxID=2512213 RepID=UPI001F546DA9|nr:hypothetical protein [Rhodococcus sp. SMB37]
MASVDFAERWFPDGMSAEELQKAPMLTFDRKDDMQDRFLRNEPVAGSRHPATTFLGHSNSSMPHASDSAGACFLIRCSPTAPIS